MDISYLPTKIKLKLEEFAGDAAPVSVVRSSGTLDGGSGEGYVVAFKDKMCFFSRGIGGGDYEFFSAGFEGNGALEKLTLDKDGLNLKLNVGIGGKDYNIRLSSFEEKDAAPMVDLWREKTGAKPISNSMESEASSSTAPPAAAPARQLSPIIAFAAAMMHMAAIDGKIDEWEDVYIRRACGDNEKILGAGLRYYKENDFETLLRDFSHLGHRQALCILANLVEVGMADGVFHRSEQRLAEQFAGNFGLSNDEIQAIRDVLTVKNQVGVLSE